jgi:hypothetical protein
MPTNGASAPATRDQGVLELVDLAGVKINKPKPGVLCIRRRRPRRLTACRMSFEATPVRI